jgi:CHAT domain-containing protein/tetratricopeptide (TPR) repeat protein
MFYHTLVERDWLNRHRRLYFSGLAGLAIALSACQTGTNQPPVLSLEEAKQVTATFEGKGFVPPPKTINDITAILDQQKRANPVAAEQARATAAKEPSADLTGESLAGFYRERGLAARDIGNINQQIADMRKAMEISSDANGETRMRRIWDVSVAELVAGKYAESIRLREKAIGIAEGISKKGTLISYYSLIATHYARGGDLDAADRMIAKARAILAQSVKWKSAGQWRDGWNGMVARAEANVLDVRGRSKAAEPLYHKSLTNLISDMENNTNSRSAVYRALLVNATRGELAKNLVHQGRLAEAEVEARKALTDSLSRVGRYSQDTAHMLKSLVIVIAAQGRFPEAESLSRAVLDILHKIGVGENTIVINRARRNLARTLVNQGLWQQALAEYDTIEHSMSGDKEAFSKYFGADLFKAQTLLRVGRASEALPIAAAALERRIKKVGQKHFKTAIASAILAMSQAGTGMQKEALDNFQQAIPVLLSRSRQSSDENTSQGAREQQKGMILESYIGLLADIRGTAIETEAGINAADEAFRIADVARGQSVQRALIASSARATAGNVELADFARREQDTRKQIATLYALLADVASLPTDQQDPQAMEQLRINIDQLRGARAALMEEIETRFPSYAQLINPKPASVADARAVLESDEALISTFVGEKKTYIWAVPKDGQVAFATANVGHLDLEESVAILRSALEPNVQTLGEIPDFDLETANEIYTALLKPVEPGWKKSKSLLVVAHGPLGYLPMSILPTAPATLPPESGALFSNHAGIPWLARSHAVTVLPSVASLRTLRALPPGAAGRKDFVGFGDPYFSVEQATQASTEKAIVVAANATVGMRGRPVKLRAAPNTGGLDSAELAQLPRLPDTLDEIKSIALALDADLTKDVFLGRSANEGAVKTNDLSGYKVLAFATHGLVPGDLNGLLQPALALTAPAVAGVEGDGLLTMEEILGLRLDADWVVLSACNTGSGDGAGAEAVSGLGRAFFYAGTRALLVSNWPVETTSAKMLTTELFRQQRQNPMLSRAEALRKAMVGLIDNPGYKDAESGKIVFSYAHPIFWAPFSLIGDGGNNNKPQS